MGSNRSTRERPNEAVAAPSSGVFRTDAHALRTERRKPTPRTPGVILIAGGDSSSTRDLSTWTTEAGWDVHSATTVEVAQALRGRVRGLIVCSESLGDDDLDLIIAARKACAGVPLLLLARRYARTIQNRAQKLGIECARGPIHSSNLRAFLGRCEEAKLKRPWEIVEEMVSAHGLPPAPSTVVVAAVESSALKDISKRLGRSVHTIKSQVDVVRERTGAASLEDVVAPIRRALLGGYSAVSRKKGRRW
jgi:DNA-binding NarL/FixJ family response regulator